MNVTSPSRADLAGTAPTPSRRVVDAPTRAFHWLLALSFVGAFITADGERWRLVHVTLGYTVIGLVAFRLLWALVGPQSTRFSAWASKLRAAPAFVRSLADGRPNGVAATRLLNTLAIVSLLALAVLVTASGYALYNELAGEWLEDVHEVLGNAMLAVVLGHIALVVAVSLLRRQNQAMAMVTGRAPGRGPDLVKRNLAPLAAGMFVAVLAFWVWQWQTAPGPDGLAGPGWTEPGHPAGDRDRKRRHDDANDD